MPKLTVNDEILTLAKNVQDNNPGRFAQLSSVLNRVGIHDGNAVGWGVGALEYVIQQAYAVQHKPNIFRELMPLNTSYPETTESISYRVYDYTGKGKRGHSKGTNRDTSDLVMRKVQYEVYEGFAPTAEWGYMELLRCRQVGIAIDQERLNAARIAYENHMDDVALFGELGQPGLLNNTTVVTTVVAPNGGSSGSNDIAVMTPDEILALVNDSLNKVREDSLTNEYPDTVLTSLKAHQILTSRRLGTDSDVSIMTYLLENNVAKAAKNITLKFVPVLGLENISAPANPHRMVFYTNNSNKLEMALPMPIKFLPPETSGTDIVVHNLYTYSTPHVRYPKSMLYVDHN